jgi:hypothetical protein
VLNLEKLKVSHTLGGSPGGIGTVLGILGSSMDHEWDWISIIIDQLRVLVNITLSIESLVNN